GAPGPASARQARPGPAASTRERARPQGRAGRDRFLPGGRSPPGSAAPRRAARRAGRRLATQVGAGVYVVAVVADLEVEMRAGRVAGAALIADDLAPVHDLSSMYARREAAHMTVEGGVPVSVVDDTVDGISAAVVVGAADTAV